MSNKNELEQAYEFGAKLAAVDAGLVKLAEGEGGSIAWPTLLGGLGGAIAAPEGKRLAGFGGAGLGSAAGATAGSLGGAGLGALVGLLTRKPHLVKTLGLGGGLLGGLGGSAYGGAKGYQAAIGD